MSSSKTLTAAVVTLWWLTAFGPNARAFTTAPTFRQVELNIWSEIGKLYRQAKIPIGDPKALLSTQLKLDRDWYAIGFATDKPDYVHGIHGPNDLLILDEGQGIPQPMFDAVENMMAGGNTKFLCLFNPTSLSGETYDANTRKAAMYNNIKISAWDTPNVRERRIVIPGMLTYEQVLEWYKVYQKDSNFCRVKVDAEFPKQESDTLVPLNWLDLATTRVVEKEGVRVMGLDVARFGDDDSVWGWRAGRNFKGYDSVNGNDTMQVSGKVALFMDENKIEDCFVDVIGVGGGVYDRLHEMKYNVHSVNAGEKATEEDRFVNRRSEMWWAARESFDPSNMAAMVIQKDNRLIAELSSVKYKIRSDKRIEVESKEEMKKRLGHSPDVADMYCLCVYQDYTPGARPAYASSGSTLIIPHHIPRPKWA